jgi:hypothetical protein
MPELIIAICRCCAEKVLCEGFLDIFYHDMTFKLQLLNDWKLNGFKAQAMKYVRKLEILLQAS